MTIEGIWDGFCYFMLAWTIVAWTVVPILQRFDEMPPVTVKPVPLNGDDR